MLSIQRGSCCLAEASNPNQFRSLALPPSVCLLACLPEWAGRQATRRVRGLSETHLSLPLTYEKFHSIRELFVTENMHNQDKNSPEPSASFNLLTKYGFRQGIISALKSNV